MLTRAALLTALLLAAGCSGPSRLADPMAELVRVPNSPRRHLAAMEQLDPGAGADAAYNGALHRMIWAPGYTVAVREAALERLERLDPEGLQRTIRQHLPRIDAPDWHERLCTIIAERRWVEQTHALVSSLAHPVLFVEEADRPEHRALVALHGRVADVVFAEMLAADRPSEAIFRGRCWALLHRLGERERLIALLGDVQIAPDDAMLLDLRAARDELGLVPHNREEIEWVRRLRRPERAGFWSEAVSAMSGIDAQRRSTMELRDLAVAVAAARHDPELLRASEAELLRRLERRLDGRRRYTSGRGDGFTPRGSQRLADVAEPLTWGDLAAMLLALRALEVPQVVDHLADYAERDRADASTEYGGVIDVDERGRFEVLEFPPRIRAHDQKFIASQEMMDASRTALFHFHFHAQRIDNDEYAGPGLGDATYAENTRANCLVLTSVGRDRLNVDFYRHGGVVVDLGVIERPSRHGMIEEPAPRR